jgi:hypothetical protein
MSASKAKGTRAESAIVEYLRRRGWLQAERRALAGRGDKGDVTGVPCVIECKNTNRLDLAGAVDEANAEAANACADIGVAWIKRRGKGDPADWYVAMDGRTFTELLSAWDKDAS